ncbi:MAG: hypothetical protein ACTHUU_09130 [Brachybacterium sp.]
MAALTAAMTKAIDIAREAPNGRHADLLIHDGPLRQTVIALKKGTELPEHNSPPAASIQVFHGSLRVTGEEPAIIESGHIEALTHFRHAVEALEDTVFLLTTVTSQHDTESHSTPTGEMPVLSSEEQAREHAEMDHESGGGRTDR